MIWAAEPGSVQVERHDMADLTRFRDAQDQAHSGFDAALREIRAGRKQSHWIWYIFPQLAGLGSSSLSRFYALRDTVEAADYLRDHTLRDRLLTMTIAVRDQL